MSLDLYQRVTDTILEKLKHGVVPWKKPWNESYGLPRNAVTQRKYRGVNIFLLASAPFTDPRWLTFNQLKEIGGKVRKGEKATLVIFWKIWKPQVDDGRAEQVRSLPLLKSFSVFNMEQVEGLTMPALPEPTVEDRHARAEALFRSMPNPPSFQEKGTSAWYLPSKDLVQVPPRASFVNPDMFYSVKAHEFIHSTGNEVRLARKGVTGSKAFGSSDYGHEELIAEFGASFLCSLTGLDNSHLDDSASYIANWSRAIAANPKQIVFAAAQAQKAADFVCGVQYS